MGGVGAVRNAVNERDGEVPLLVLVLPSIMAGIPAADDNSQMITLIILALTGVRKSRALMG